MMLGQYVDPKTGQPLSSLEGRRRVVAAGKAKPTDVAFESVNPAKRVAKAVAARSEAELGRKLTKRERRDLRKIVAAQQAEGQP